MLLWLANTAQLVSREPPSRMTHENRTLMMKEKIYFDEMMMQHTKSSEHGEFGDDKTTRDQIRYAYPANLAFICHHVAN